MINLTTTSDIMRLVTSAAVALDVHADFVDHTTSAYTPGRQNTTITTATTTTVVAAPAASTQRQLKHMIICARGGANTVTVEFFDGANAFRMHSFALVTGEVLEYTDTDGWRTMDPNGAIQTISGPGMLLRPPQLISATNAAFPHPVGTRTIVVEGIGGGGASGGAAAVAGSAGSGGNSGTWGRGAFTSVSGTSNVVVGAGGTAGAAGAAGNNGVNSTFTHNGTTITLPGGIGGVVLAGAGTIAQAAANGANAAATNATMSVPGELGGRAWRPAVATSPTMGGYGGRNPFGSGGEQVLASTATVAGNSGTGFGSGASGRSNGSSAVAQAGVAGQPGFWMVWEYG